MEPEEVEKGCLLQYAARIAYDWGRKNLATELQQRAFAANRNVMSYRALASTLARLFSLNAPAFRWTHLHAGLSRRTVIAIFRQLIAEIDTSKLTKGHPHGSTH
jgi:hypothetical protein